MIDRITCKHCKDQDNCIFEKCYAWIIYEIEDVRLAKKAKGEIMDNRTKKVEQARKKSRRW